MASTRIRAVAAGLFTLPALVCVSALRFQHAAVGEPAGSDPYYAGSVWIGETTGMARLSVPEGSVALRINAEKNIRALAVDEWNGKIWAYGGSTLLAFGFDGQRLLTVPVKVDHDHDDDCEERHVVICMDPKDGGVWLGAGKSLTHIDSQGGIGARISLSQPVMGIARDSVQSRLWVATPKSVFACDETGSVLATLPLPKKAEVGDIAFDPSTNRLFVALKDALRIHGPEGALIQEERIEKAGKIERIASDGHGSLWIGTDKSLLRLDASGMITRLPASCRQNKLGPFTGLAADPADGSVWAAEKKRLLHVSKDGAMRHVASPRPASRGRLWTVCFYRDTLAPSISIISPEAGSFTNNSRPRIEISFKDTGTGVDPDSLVLSANGEKLETSCGFGPTGALCTPASSLADGKITLGATVKDYEGNTSSASIPSFTIDTAPPRIDVVSPKDGLTTNHSPQIISGKLSEEADLAINGRPVAVDGEKSFTWSVVLEEGKNTFALSATDKAGNKGEASLTISLDTIAPRITISSPAEGASTNQPARTITGRLSEAADLSFNGQNVPLGTGLDFSIGVTLVEGINSFAFSATDPAGNKGGQPST